MENVTVSKEYLDSLIDQINELREENAKYANEVAFLEALRAAGVDGWVGYELAQELMNE